MFELQVVSQIIDENDGSLKIDINVVPSANNNQNQVVELSKDGLNDYFVIVEDHSHLESLYTDLETENNSSNTGISRAVECVERRPSSRSTLYKLTAEEAEQLLKNDDRVLDVELHPKYRGIKPISQVLQYSSNFDKSSVAANTMINWGLLRCTTGQQISGWGGLGYNGTGVNTTPVQSGTIELTNTGRNVDVIDVDDQEIVWEHPEFAKNADGSGGSRLNYFNWWQYNPAVNGTTANTYPAAYGYTNLAYYYYHPTHVTGIMGGNTQGYARDANLYHIYYGTQDPNGSSYVFNYVTEFHKNKAINPATGVKNPTICNNSWGFGVSSNGGWAWTDVTDAYYRGTTYTGPVYTGFLGGITTWLSSGFYAHVQPFFNWTDYENYEHLIRDYGNMSITGSPTTSNILGPASLNVSTTPTTGNNNIGYWTLSLPFPVAFGSTPTGDGYLGLGANTFTTIYVNTNSSVTFTEPSLQTSGFSNGYSGGNQYDLGTPKGTKFMWCSGNHSIQRIYYGTEGTAPNRTFRVRIEGDANSTGTLGSPGMLSEWHFYENAYSNRVSNPVLRVCFGQNNSVSRPGTKLTYNQISSFGLQSGQTMPSRSSAVDADVEDAIKKGVILVGAAGNSNWKCDIPGGDDYNNYIQMQMKYGTSVYYYHRGQSPTANDSKALGGNYDIPMITVGATDSIEYDRKSGYSNSGPGVDIWAPGTYISSSIAPGYGSGTQDIRPGSSANSFVGKISGTSMATPQVTGVLACALETYPTMSQIDAKNYIISISKQNQVSNVSISGYANNMSLMGAANIHLYYNKERNSIGTVFPKVNFKARPATGQTYPRPRIKRTT